MVWFESRSQGWLRLILLWGGSRHLQVDSAAAFTMAAMPARMAAGRRDQAHRTALSCGSSANAEWDAESEHELS